MDSLMREIFGLVPGMVGALLGGAVSWGVAKQKMSDFERRLAAIETKVSGHEQLHSSMIERLTRVETKIDIKFTELDRTLEAIRAFISKQ